MVHDRSVRVDACPGNVVETSIASVGVISQAGREVKMAGKSSKEECMSSGSRPSGNKDICA